LGRTTEVLVDQVRPPRSHDHDGGIEHRPRVAGRNRQNKLVHLAGGPELVGRLVDVRIEHAGPYSLVGALA
jgi:tRNA A37 methylthiotransferase MiaB